MEFGVSNIGPSSRHVHASLMFAASPDSHSFQHWSDRVAMMLVQTERHRNNATKYITMAPRYILGTLCPVDV